MTIYEMILQFINPALLILIPLLYVIGIALKKAEKVNDKNIPLVLGAVSIVLSTLWILGTADNLNLQGSMLAIFTAIVQGGLCAGASVYVYQIIKQANK